MPPRGNPGRGGGPNRGVPARGGRGATHGDFQVGLPSSSSHITTVGVKRPDFGTGGKTCPIYVNSFVTTIPDDIIHHYDGMVVSRLYYLVYAEYCLSCLFSWYVMCPLSL
jgi:eukaryotic translation initiation factor 2C